MDKKGIHWPSCMHFLFAALSLGAAIFESSLHDYFFAAGFACLGYSSIRLVRADHFTQKISLSRYMTVPSEVRPIDVTLLSIGLGLLLVGLVVRYAG